MAQIIGIGEKFPEFSIPSVTSIEQGKEFSTLTSTMLSGKWSIIFFWPLDFTFICPTEIIEFDRMASAFKERGADLYGASLDSKYVHLAWRKSNKNLTDISFPMLADNKRELSEALGILHPKAKIPLRATYIIDPEGIVRWLSLNDIEVGRNVHEVLRTLDALQTGELCPVNWQRGQKTV